MSIEEVLAAMFESPYMDYVTPHRNVPIIVTSVDMSQGTIEFLPVSSRDRALLRRTIIAQGIAGSEMGGQVKLFAHEFTLQKRN